jgi:hypothetical protein
VLADGTKQTVADKLPSMTDAYGGNYGPTDVAFIGSTLYVLIELGGCSHAMQTGSKWNWIPALSHIPSANEKGLASLQGLDSKRVFGSSTWARTRDLRINSHIRKVE